MKSLRLLSIIATALLLFACGSATEVGNPTGTIPTRTVTGVVDTSAFDESTTAEMAVDAAISPTEFSVLATASGEDTEEAFLDEEGAFTMVVRIRTTYEWEIRLGEEKVGDFSFAQRGGSRSNRLRIENMGDEILLGTVRYEEGSFIPEFEPIDQDDGIGASEMGNGSGQQDTALEAQDRYPEAYSR